jgi:hypothetical protein
LISDVSSSVVIIVPGLTRPPTLTAPQSCATAERSADHGVVEPRLCGGYTRFIRLQRRFDLIHLRSGQHLRIRKRPAPLVVGATLDSCSFGRCEISLRLRRVELDEHRAAPDQLTFLEADCGHGVGSLRRNADGFVGARRADRFDIDLQLPLRDGLRHDRDHVRSTAAGSASWPAGRRLRCAVRAGNQEQPEKREDTWSHTHRDAGSWSSTKS